MTWVHVLAAAAGLASMRAAMQRGDVDEAARQGALAGPVIIEEGLASPDRTTRLAAIAAAPSSEDRAGLLDALARAAAGPDRRTAIPAARAARTIATELAAQVAGRDLPDDIAPDDALAWRDAWAALALRTDRWIELRVIALDTAASLDRAANHSGIGLSLETALADRDPAFRRAAINAVPSPAPDATRALLSKALDTDTDNAVAIAAANVLCFDGAALGPAGLARVKSLAVKRCLAKH